MRGTIITRRRLGTLALAGGVGLGALGLAAPAQAESCFWTEFGQTGSKRCYNVNVKSFTNHTFPNGEPMRNASSWQNLNWSWNEVVYNGANYTGASQELEDESVGDLNGDLNNRLASYDAA
ncbi:hypothetical protein [Actinomadura rugatobispora]|uniref:Peptidase inhibitor family I36 n=1 Tax=Actinomadura rugatobispora TaxID=1994 RepID=A0ABW1ACP4_9ACTN|nr:hypothetical protein GCM10010200_026540 [Actinomadura rugatobispora]